LKIVANVQFYLLQCFYFALVQQWNLQSTYLIWRSGCDSIHLVLGSSTTGDERAMKLGGKLSDLMLLSAKYAAGSRPKHLHSTKARVKDADSE
jgi:hypothetical protein